MRRRKFLEHSVKLAALLASPSGFTATDKNRTGRFSLGVASGSPSADGATIWSRLIDDVPLTSNFEVVWEVSEDDSFKKVVAKGIVVARPELAHSVHVDLQGLTSNRLYFYRFTAGDAFSDVGRLRTLPAVADFPKKLRLAYASCQRWEDGQFAAYRHMLNDNPEFVLFLGDYIYEYASRKEKNAVRTHSLTHIGDLEGYRARYALYRSDPLLQKMHAACPWLLTWDDHEVENNYAGNASLEGTNNLFNLRIAAYQAFYEHMPIRRSTVLGGIAGLMRGEPLLLHDAYDFGSLARIHMLDNRQYRSRPVCGNSPSSKLAKVCTVNFDVASSMLGHKQEQWLTQSFATAKQNATIWNVIGQQTRFTPANYPHGIGKHASSDSWDGYPESRQRLIDEMKHHALSNPLVIGGDIHQNWVANVHENPYDVRSPVIASEFCGTSISSHNNRPQTEADRTRERNPHCLLINMDKRGYGLIDLKPDSVTVQLRVLDDVTNIESGIQTLDKFKVRTGHPIIERY